MIVRARTILPSGRKQVKKGDQPAFTIWDARCGKNARRRLENVLAKVRAYAHSFITASSRVPPRTCEAEINAGVGRGAGRRHCCCPCVPILKLTAKHRFPKRYLVVCLFSTSSPATFHASISACDFSRASCAALFWRVFVCTPGWFRVSHGCEQTGLRGGTRSSRLRRAL